jgi:GT2 family glycosyltransferase
VDVIIVNWNVGPELVEATASALRFGGSPIVVDNASSRGSLDAAAALSGVRVVRLPHNLGFAAGCHAGVSAGDAPHLLFLNPDAAILRGCATDLVSAFHAPGPCIVAVALEDGAGRPIPSTHPIPTPAWLLLELLPSRVVRAVRAALPHGVPGPWVGEPIGRDRFVVGSALAMRREDWVAVGGMDTGYRLWHEDVDLSRRVIQAGGDLRWAPGVTVRHLGGRSWGQLPRWRRRWWRSQATLHYARRHHSVAVWLSALLLAGPLIAGGALQDTVGWVVRRLGRS